MARTIKQPVRPGGKGSGNGVKPGPTQPVWHPKPKGGSEPAQPKLKKHTKTPAADQGPVGFDLGSLLRH